MAKKIDPANVSTLISALGGKENIATLTHCITRLRFVLNDDSKFCTGGQYQVVIGQEVGDYYKAVLEQAGLEGGVSKDQVKAAAHKNQKWYESAISHMADILFRYYQH